MLSGPGFNGSENRRRRWTVFVACSRTWFTLNMRAFLHKLLGRRDEFEEELEELYFSLFRSTIAMNDGEIRSLVRTMIRRAKEQARRERTNCLPVDHGERLLIRELVEDEVRAEMALRRADGVTDSDIRWWWNMPDLERRLLLATDDISRIAAIKAFMDQGHDEDDAVARMRKLHPIYGRSIETTGEDRALPCELKERVNIWTKRRIMEDQENFNAEMEAATTFNALVRGAIRRGLL